MKHTKLELVSFENGLSNKKRLELATEIINSTKSDILLFPGHTIGFVNEIEELRQIIKNSKTEVILELEKIGSSKINNCLYRITKGEIISLNTNQIFSTSDEIHNNFELASRLLFELEYKRYFKIKGKNVLILQCGEINILKNFQSENNRVEFRLSDDSEMNAKFKNILSRTDIVLNPIHSPMGNQGKMEKRRQFLSKNKKYYFSTSNTKPGSKNLSLSSLQYAFYNQKPIKELNIYKGVNFISRVYEII